MFSAHRILPKTCDLGSLCHQHLNKKSSKNGIRQTLQKRYPKISKQTHTQRPKRIPKVTQHMCIYINTENQPNNEQISTEFWQSMDTRSYSKNSKTKSGRRSAFFLCFYCFVVPRVLQCRCKLLRHAPLQACGLLYIGPGRDQARTWRTTVKSKTDKKREGEHLKEHLIPRLHAKDKKRPPK